MNTGKHISTSTIPGGEESLRCRCQSWRWIYWPTSPDTAPSRVGFSECWGCFCIGFLVVVGFFRSRGRDLGMRRCTVRGDRSTGRNWSLKYEDNVWAEWQAYGVFAHYVAMESYMSRISTKFECHTHHSQVLQVAFNATSTPFPSLMGGSCIRHVSQCSSFVFIWSESGSARVVAVQFHIIVRECCDGGNSNGPCWLAIRHKNKFTSIPTVRSYGFPRNLSPTSMQSTSTNSKAFSNPIFLVTQASLPVLFISS